MLLGLLATCDSFGGLRSSTDKLNASKSSRFLSKSGLSMPNGISALNLSKVDPIQVVSVHAVSTNSVGSMVAKILGYIMGIGSMSIYTPIIIDLLKAKNADGFSVATWIFNIVGVSLAAYYPLKRGFPLSSFIELIVIAVQAVFVLGLISYYKNQMLIFSLGMVIFSLLSFVMMTISVSSSFLNMVQILAILLCNYANVPQIMLTFKTRNASWSPITAGMSVVGNLIRVYTTIQLTGDWLVLSGYSLGFATNSILLVQSLFYGKK
eukprot:gene14631-19651_t